MLSSLQNLNNIQFLLLILSFFFIIFLSGSFFYRKTYLFYRSLKLKRRFKTAKCGETKARDFLIKKGFTILKEQAVIFPVLIVDNQKHQFSLRADFIVQKNGIKALVDAKTGSAANPVNPSTRRQLLEYFVNYGVKKVYVFDSKKKALREVSFKNTVFPDKKLFLYGVIVGSFLTIFLILLFTEIL